MWGGQLDVKPI